MVADSTHSRPRGDGDRSNDRPDRGQVILIGAVALAFIVLGVVVVFNGVLYTETLSSADTGQTASSADATELEVRQGIACLAAEHEGDQLEEGSVEDNTEILYENGTLDVNETLEEYETQLIDDIKEYGKLFQNATAHSRPATVNISVAESDLQFTNDSGTVAIEDSVTVLLAYDSSESSYERMMEIYSNECPESNGSTGGDNAEDGNDENESESENGNTDEISVESFTVTPGEKGDHTVNWEINGTNISDAYLTIDYDPHSNKKYSNPIHIDEGDYNSGTHVFDLKDKDDVNSIAIVVNGDTLSEWPEE